MLPLTCYVIIILILFLFPRFMPEPNLPPLRVNLKTKEDSKDVISVPLIRDTIPELPEESRKRIIEKYRVRPEIAIQLVNEPALWDLFQGVTQDETRDPTKVANLLMNDLLTVLNKNKLEVTECPVTTTQLCELTDLLLTKKINLDAFKQILNELVENPDSERSPARLVADKGLSLVTDDDEITQRCNEVIEENPKLVQQYKNGKVKVFKALLGILTKNTQGKIDMAQASEKLKELLKK